jgi:hypothetical protein
MIKKLKIGVVLTALLIGWLAPMKATAQDLQPVDYSQVSIAGGGISFGYYGYGFAGSRSIGIPPLTAFYEMGVHQNITAGPFISYARWDYRWGVAGSTWGYNWSFLTLGGRGTLHLTSLINEWFDTEIDVSRWDLYGTAILGLEFRRFSYTGTGFPGEYDNDWRLFLGPVLGARYYFSNNIGVYLEGGRGSLGAFTVGVSATF